MYNSGGYCNGFESLIRDNIVYPELKTNLLDKFTVPLKIRISEDGNLYDIKSVTTNYINVLNSKYTNTNFTNDSEFDTEAKRLLGLTRNWTPCTFYGEYVDIEITTFIDFFYHKEYFRKAENSFVLNPDIKPKFIGGTDIYDKIIKPSNGSDGQCTFIAIVDLNGKISNEYCLSCQGKTNPKIGLSYLSKLSNWQPAFKNSKEVKSQIVITVQTQ